MLTYGRYHFPASSRFKLRAEEKSGLIPRKKPSNGIKTAYILFGQKKKKPLPGVQEKKLMSADAAKRRLNFFEGGGSNRLPCEKDRPRKDDRVLNKNVLLSFSERNVCSGLGETRQGALDAPEKKKRRASLFQKGAKSPFTGRKKTASGGKKLPDRSRKRKDMGSYMKDTGKASEWYPRRGKKNHESGENKQGIGIRPEKKNCRPLMLWMAGS